MFARQIDDEQETEAERFKNIDALVRDNGDVTIGRIGPVRCAEVAADGDQQPAMLVRRPKESLEELLDRLDVAIGKAWDEVRLSVGADRRRMLDARLAGPDVE